MLYPAHLTFHEQLQLFLYDADYFYERIIVPGGLSVYIADFLTQFYYHPWVGAIILSVLFVALQRITWIVAKRHGANETYYPLSFLPAIAIWHYMGDENGMLTYLIALICAMVSVHGYLLFGRRAERLAYDYLMAYQLLKGDLQHFIEYLPLIQFSNYTQIPHTYQEALVFAWAQRNANFDEMPWNVSNNVKQAMSDFIKLYKTSTNPEHNLLKNRYGKTFWYYITNRNQP